MRVDLFVLRSERCQQRPVEINPRANAKGSTRARDQVTLILKASTYEGPVLYFYFYFEAERSNLETVIGFIITLRYIL
jgi:hypothetical protein